MTDDLQRWLKTRDLNTGNPTTVVTRDPIDVDTVQSPPKRLKLTAANGAVVAARYEQQMMKRTSFASQTRRSPAQTPTRKLKSRAKLGLLPTLPIDILYEIFGHCAPVDLLRVARTNKAFRAILICRSAMSIWKESRSHIDGLPACPPDLSEPQYADLVFDSSCHECATKGVPTSSIYWEFRIRLCSRCAKELIKNDAIHPIQADARNYIPTVWQNDDVLYLQRDVDHFIAERSVRQKSLEAGLICKNEFDEWLETCEKRKYDIQRHAAECDEWVDEQVEARFNALESVRAERRTSIEDRLHELGYTDVLNLMSVPDFARGIPLLHQLPDVRRPRPLTERTWKNIKPQIIAYMDRMRAHFAREARLKLIRKRRRIAAHILRRFNSAYSYEPTQLSLSPADFCHLPEVQQIIELPNQVAVREATFTLLLDRLPALLETWRAERILTLSRKTPGRWLFSNNITSARERLELATTVFCCSAPLLVHGVVEDSISDEGEQEYEGMWYPHFLHHACCTLRESGEDDSAEDGSSALGEGFAGIARRPWSSDVLVFDEKASMVVAQVVRACGLDPRNTTAAEMDKNDWRFACDKCLFGKELDGERVTFVRSWRSTVQHVLQKHWGNPRVRLIRISNEDTERARAKEIEEEQYHRALGKKRPKEACWKCASCVDTPREAARMKKSSVLRHLRVEHGKDLPQESVDFYRARDARPRLPVSVKIAPHPDSVEPFEDVPADEDPYDWWYFRQNRHIS